ncbi:unnamed protein product [Paramecium primaurelia]|uniref:Uncharacterized protein n=1 Tax=Paramecium primaurelia TaxID=5886 RepID=A0A8S1LIW0_PARPR|nr:unnamed protein product [Paramecium primaurelia]
MSSEELPQDKKTLFSSLVQKKHAETDAQKIQNRILQLKMEHEKVMKRIQQDEERADEIYRHRVEIQLKKENKLKQKQAQPPPFSLAISHHQRQILKKIKDDDLIKKKSDAKLFREQLKKDFQSVQMQKSLDQEVYRIKAIQVKEEERQSTEVAVLKMKQKREKVRYQIENEKDQIIKEKKFYDFKISELEQQEQLAMMELQNSLANQQFVQKKIEQAQKLSPSDYEKQYQNNNKNAETTQ